MTSRGLFQPQPFLDSVYVGLESIYGFVIVKSQGKEAAIARVRE